MIQSRTELTQYLEADKKALNRKEKKPAFSDLIWRYERHLRYLEYYSNTPKTVFKRFILLWHKYWRSALGVKCGFSIALNTTGKGLCLSHYGTVIISQYAHVGDNCRIHAGVNIGADFRASEAAPTIGNNVYLGPGAKLFGSIVLADGIAVGANAVVNKSFEEKNISIGGIPAKKISDKGTEGVLF